jgi:predicted AAA+ superfamily ATPase
VVLGRHIAPRVEAALADTPAVMLVGARQVGKSTLMRGVASTVGARSAFSLNDAATRAAARRDPTGFIRSAETPCVIDEAQRAPDILLAIQDVVDERRQAGGDDAGMFLLTGSASIWDTLEAPESLAGRIGRIAMWPFSQGELRGTRESLIDALFAGEPPRLTGEPTGRASIAAAAITGGYPLVQRRTAQRRAGWFDAHLAAILERDVRDLMDIRSPEDLDQLLRFAATRAGNLLNLDGMLGDLGINKSTGRRYYALLKRVFLIEELPAWGRNLGRAARKSPKLLFSDTGLLAHLASFDSERFQRDPYTRPGPGNIFENFIATEILKQASWSDPAVRVFHWRDHHDREIDIMLERRDGSVVAIESKLDATVREDDLRHLIDMRDKLGADFQAGAIIYTGPNTLPFGDRLWALPATALWSVSPQRPARSRG